MPFLKISWNICTMYSFGEPGLSPKFNFRQPWKILNFNLLDFLQGKISILCFFYISIYFYDPILDIEVLDKNQKLIYIFFNDLLKSILSSLLIRAKWVKVVTESHVMISNTKAWYRAGICLPIKDNTVHQRKYSMH